METMMRQDDRQRLVAMAASGSAWLARAEAALVAGRRAEAIEPLLHAQGLASGIGAAAEQHRLGSDVLHGVDRVLGYLARPTAESLRAGAIAMEMLRARIFIAIEPEQAVPGLVA
ncbi:MAG: hypothetical protein NW201_12680 [Gemmatimonadales bacterium]|nr:hypothetical protein [Gemmatimonadales bacterium]